MFPTIVQPGVLNVWSEKYDQRNAVPWTSDSSAKELCASSREQGGPMSFEVPDTPFQKL